MWLFLVIFAHTLMPAAVSSLPAFLKKMCNKSNVKAKDESCDSESSATDKELLNMVQSNQKKSICLTRQFRRTYDTFISYRPGSSLPYKNNQNREPYAALRLHVIEHVKKVLSAFETQNPFADLNVNAQDVNGCTLLHYAAMHREALCVMRLLYFGANPNIKNSRGNTALHVAAAIDLGNPDRLEYNILKQTTRNIIELLCGKGDLHARNTSARTPLHQAILHDNLIIALSLIDKGADINACDNLGRTPLFYAIKRKHNIAAHALIINGARVMVCDKLGSRPIEIIADPVAREKFTSKLKKDLGCCKYKLKT